MPRIPSIIRLRRSQPGTRRTSIEERLADALLRSTRVSLFSGGFRWWHLALVIAAATFVVDLFFPAGVAVGIPYTVVVMLAFWSQRSRTPLGLAAVCTLLIIAGYFLSPGTTALGTAISNRALTVLAVWAVATATAAMVAGTGTIQKQRDSISCLSRELTEAETRERERIAQVLHDELQQLLFSAQLALALEDSGSLRALLNESMELTRSLSRELKPPVLSSASLKEVLWSIAERSRAHHLLEVQLKAQEDFSIPDHMVRVVIQQVVSELLFNVVKHSGVKQAELSVGRDNGFLNITVADNGNGFDPGDLRRSTPDGLGIVTATQRLEFVGGRFVIDSAPGQGTRSSLLIPEHVLTTNGGPRTSERGRARGEPG